MAALPFKRIIGNPYSRYLGQPVRVVGAWWPGTSGAAAKKQYTLKIVEHEDRTIGHASMARSAIRPGRRRFKPCTREGAATKRHRHSPRSRRGKSPRPQPLPPLVPPTCRRRELQSQLLVDTRRPWRQWRRWTPPLRSRQGRDQGVGRGELLCKGIGVLCWDFDFLDRNGQDTSK